jgi:hypothetical protein
MTLLETIATVVGIIGGTVALMMALFNPLLKKTRAMFDAWDGFMRDWNGQPAEAGRDETPGVMERLNNIDGEFKKNSGSTLKDAIARIEKKLDEVDDRLKEGDERMSRIETKLEKK